MGLQSLQYCAFLVVVAAVYLHLPVRMQPVFLLGASWVFYALAMPAMLPVTIALAVFTYLCGRGLAWRGGAHKTAFLRLGVIGMLGILAFFKYNGLLGGVLHGWRAVAMPLGISFTSCRNRLPDRRHPRRLRGGNQLYPAGAVPQLFCHRHPGAHLPRRCTAAAVERRAPL